MCRLLFFPILILGIYLFFITATMTDARRQEPTQWLYYSAEGYLYRTDTNATITEQIGDAPLTLFYHEAELSEDGRYLFYATEDENLDAYAVRLDLTTGIPEQLTEQTDMAYYVKTSLHDEWLYYERRANQSTIGLYRLNLTTHQSEEIAPNIGLHSIYAWSQTRDWFIYQQQVNGERELFRFDIESRTSYNFTNNAVLDYFVTFSPDEAWVYYVSEPGATWEFSRYNFEQGITEKVLGEENYFLNFEGWSADGEWMLFESGIIFALNPDDGTIVDLTNPRTRYEQVQRWSPDREWLYFLSDRDPEFHYSQLYRMHIDGSDQQRLTDIDEQIRIVGYSPDHEWVFLNSYTSQQTHTLWKMRPEGSDLTLITQADDFILLEAWSPDMQWMIVHFETESEGEAFYRISLEDGGIVRLTDYYRHTEFFALSEMPNMTYQSSFLLIFATIFIGKGLCVAYFCS